MYERAYGDFHKPTGTPLQYVTLIFLTVGTVVAMFVFQFLYIKG